MGVLEGAHHGGDVVAINRAHVGEAQLLKHRTHLGHGQTAHATLEILELGGQLPVQEGKIADRFLGVVGEKLHRFAQPHSVEVGREGSHWRGD